MLALLLIGSVLFVQHQERKAYDEAHASARRELDLLASLIKTHLDQGQYEGATQAIQAWGGKEAHVVSLSLLAGNGFSLGDYRRPAASARSLRMETDIPYAYHGQAKLILVTDLDPIRWHTQTLALQLGGAYVLLALLLVALTRLMLLHRGEAAALRARSAELAEAMAHRAAAEAERDRLVSVLEATTDLIGMADPKGNILYVNHAGRRMIGLVDQEVAGLPISAIHPPWAYERIVREGIPEAVRTGAWTGETALLGPDGREIPVSQVILSHRDAQGQLEYLSTIMRDITERKQTEGQLSHFKDTLEEAQAIAHLGSWDLDLATGKASWSQEEFRLLGYAPGAVESSVDNFLVRVHPEDRDRVWAEMQAAMTREDGHYRVEHRVALPDGAERIVLEQGRVSFDDTHRPLRMVGTTLDVTELRRAERELEAHRLRLEDLVAERTREVRDQAAIIDQIHDAVVSTDLDGRVTGWNLGAERLFGYTASEAMGQDIGMLYFDRDTLQQEVVQPLREKGAHEVEVVLRRKDGMAIDVLLSLSLRRDEEGRPVGMIGYSMDISTRKQAERQLLQRSDELADANRELEAFSYSVSHDLRAPLRAIDGFSQALQEDYGEHLDASGRDYLRRVRNAAQRMATLIDDLLELSRVSRSPLQPATVDLSRMAAEILAELQEQQPERNVAISIQPGLTAWGDPGLLRTALENLLGNAWKYTGRTAAARIEVGSEHTEAGNVFHVRDNGAGFDMRYADKLFGAFQRLHHPSEFEGTGIGLATVQRIIHRHGGRIWAQAIPGEGACFMFTLGSGPILPNPPHSDQNFTTRTIGGRGHEHD
ncbi:MAG: PAS domain-containing sensor histidine kinase [Thiobacillaceae bacterium]